MLAHNQNHLRHICRQKFVRNDTDKQLMSEKGHPSYLKVRNSPNAPTLFIIAGFHNQNFLRTVLTKFIFNLTLLLHFKALQSSLKNENYRKY